MDRPYDLVVIGTGVASKAASRCREAGWKVAIVDSRPFGGTCALRGCVPKKILVSAAAAVDGARALAGRGVRAGGVADGSEVLVYGATGAIGSAAVQIIKSLGASVTAVCSSEHVDLVARLGADRVEVSPLNLGGGKIATAHGTLPVPAPGTAEPVTLWLALVETLPAGTEGSPVERRLVRYRTVGDASCTAAVESSASTVEDVIIEVAASQLSTLSWSPADRVILSLERPDAFFPYFMACQALGLIPVPVPPASDYRMPTAFRERIRAVPADVLAAAEHAAIPRAALGVARALADVCTRSAHAPVPLRAHRVAATLADEDAATVEALVAAGHAIRGGAALGRRDAGVPNSDIFIVAFDSYHHHRAAFRFVTTPSGHRRDMIAGPDGGPQGDVSWDPVWQVATTITDEGWFAEMRIPFSQLRFSPDEHQVWGLQIERVIHRLQEEAVFAFTPRLEPNRAPRPRVPLRVVQEIPQHALKPRRIGGDQ